MCPYNSSHDAIHLMHVQCICFQLNLYLKFLIINTSDTANMNILHTLIPLIGIY